MRLAILDDYQGVALGHADWDRLRARGVEVIALREPLGSVDAAAEALADIDIVVLMRERMPVPRALVERLPSLKLVVMTGARAPSLDLAACADHGVLVCNTRNGEGKAATAELTWGLVIAGVRDVAAADRGMRAGGWHEGLRTGRILEGSRLGVLGLGAIGTRIARYGAAFGMDVVAWSPNLTAEVAAQRGARLVPREELFAESDVLTIHLVLSERSRGIVGADDLARMAPHSVLVNTSRGPLVDEDALVAALRAGRPAHAALDVYGREPLPADHPLRSLPNVTLTPHLGYVVDAVYATFYPDAVEDVEAWLDGAPIRVVTPA